MRDQYTYASSASPGMTASSSHFEYKSYGFDSISKRKGYYILKNGTKEDAEIYKFNL